MSGIFGILLVINTIFNRIYDMAVPKRKRSRSRRDKRFANKGLKPKAITNCKNCQEPTLPHAMCEKCGFYKGIKVKVSKMERAMSRVETKTARAKSAQARQKTAQAQEVVPEEAK
jgi:large subunit ribosomal protein L32